MNMLLKRFMILMLGVTLGAQASAQATSAVNDYVLGAGDLIRVTVFQSPELSMELRIPDSGVVGYPLLGDVQLGALTIAQAEKRLADGLLAGQYLKRPQVSILVTQVRGNQASVLGQAVRPGRYALEQANTRLSDLMAQAGGINPDGSDMLTVVGQRDGKPFRKQINFRLLFVQGEGVQDILIHHNDVVYVDRAAQVYVYGEVQKPGTLKLLPGMTVLKALAASGGPTLRGTQRGIRINRTDANGMSQQLTPSVQEPLQAEDVVFVPESLF